MVSATGKPIQFELVVMAAALNTVVNFCQWANVWNRELQKMWSPECFGRFWPQATENELKSSWLSPQTFFGIILLAASLSKGTWETRWNQSVCLWPTVWERSSCPWVLSPGESRWWFLGEGEITHSSIMVHQHQNPTKWRMPVFTEHLLWTLPLKCFYSVLTLCRM